jgi:hypothetical protein
VSELSHPSSERFFTAVASDENLQVRLTGSWEVVVGSLDTFGECASRLNCRQCFRKQIADVSLRIILVHILEYQNYAGYDRSSQLIKESNVGFTRVGTIVTR